MSQRIKGVFLWRVEPVQEEEFVRRWRLDSDVIQTYPGARGTMLHRPADGSGIFVGYASWESLEHRARAIALKQVEHPDLDLPANSTASISTLLHAAFVFEPDIFSTPPTQGA